MESFGLTSVGYSYRATDGDYYVDVDGVLFVPLSGKLTTDDCDQLLDYQDE